MDITSGNRNCLFCAKELKGRKDKKFCNDGCRNSFHNDLNSPVTEIVNPIINILKKNRAIVLQLLEKGEKKATRETLLKAGLDFVYSTENYVLTEYHWFFISMSVLDLSMKKNTV